MLGTGVNNNPWSLKSIKQASYPKRKQFEIPATLSLKEQSNSWNATNSTFSHFHSMKLVERKGTLSVLAQTVKLLMVNMGDIVSSGW